MTRATVAIDLGRLRTLSERWQGRGVPPRPQAIEDALNFVRATDAAAFPLRVEAETDGSVNLIADQGNTKRIYMFEGHGACTVLAHDQRGQWAEIAEFPV